VKTRAFKFASPLLVYVLSFLSFTYTGWIIYLPLVYAWIIIPLTELVLKPDDKNLSAAEEELAKNDRLYDYWLYAIVILQYLSLFYFLNSMKQPLLWYETAGRIGSMGLVCGSFGINVGHELGHRANKFEQTLAKMLLLTSLYMHFFIEHNKGHHKNVSTKEDPGSARYGEMIYSFYFRTIIFSWLSAWKIAGRDMQKKGLQGFHPKNEMLQFQVIQLIFISAIFFFYGWLITLYFLAAALMGILLLETVNYIEHYGLERKRNAEGKYERAMPHHSWNSNHILGRLMLFELSRHSDHHYLASRKYQVLRHHENAPQMPTGYPGMMLLSLLPPLWFYVMNQRIKKLPSYRMAA
jgi:alkane 1-monooxygenase